MLIEFRVQNFKSFNTEQVLNLVCSSSTREDFNENNLIPVNKFGIDSVLKSAAIFGPNAAGKSNLADAFHSLKTIVLFSLQHIDRDQVIGTLPFVIKEDFYDIPTEHEVTFVSDGVMYRYGISILNRIISEEWLYRTSASRETLMFHREGQKIDFNNRSFSEAKLFVAKEDGGYVVQKTKENIPFVSVLSQFKGEVSSVVTGWFENLNVVTGVNDDGVKEFTVNLFDEDEEFKVWALNILSAMQIQGVEVTEEEKSFPVKDTSIPELMEVAEKLGSFLKNNPIKTKQLKVVKELDGEGYVLPVEFESEGTKRLIYFLGVLYDTMKHSKILIVDEFDSKLHSLLSEYVLRLYHKNSEHASQMIVTCHDTNLLSRNIFRRDQIWFVDKNNRHESQLYSLVEYKEYYTRKDNNYSKDYLAGKYGAIPLFASLEQLVEVCRG